MNNKTKSQPSLKTNVNNNAVLNTNNATTINKDNNNNTVKVTNPTTSNNITTNNNNVNNKDKANNTKKKAKNLEDIQKQYYQAKEERLKAQKEEEVIRTRLNLLHNQEKLMISKVENTKKSMTNLRNNKMFFEEAERIRLESANRKKDELEKLKEKVIMQKTELHEGLLQSKTLKDIKSMNMNILHKEDYKQNKKMQILNKLEDILKNATLHQSVRAMENLLEEKKKRALLEKKIKMKEELMLKLQNEEITKKQLDSSIMNLEKEEIEICNKFEKIEDLNQMTKKKTVNISRK